MSELLSQRGHVYIQSLGRPPPVDVPYGLDDLLASDDGTWILGEKCEEVELLRRQDDLALEDEDAAGPVIDEERSDALHAWPAFRFWTGDRPAAHRTNSRNELTKAERFHHVVVGAELQEE